MEKSYIIIILKYLVLVSLNTTKSIFHSLILFNNIFQIKKLYRLFSNPRNIETKCSVVCGI